MFSTTTFSSSILFFLVFFGRNTFITIAVIVNPINEAQCLSCCDNAFDDAGVTAACQAGCSDITNDCEIVVNGVQQIDAPCEAGQDFLAMGFAKNPFDANVAFFCPEDGQVDEVLNVAAADFLENGLLPTLSAEECSAACLAINDELDNGLGNAFSRGACQDVCNNAILDLEDNLIPTCFIDAEAGGANVFRARLGCFLGLDLQFFSEGNFLNQNFFFFENGLVLDDPDNLDLGLEPPEEQDDNAQNVGFILGAVSALGVLVGFGVLALFRQRRTDPKSDIRVQVLEAKELDYSGRLKQNRGGPNNRLLSVIAPSISLSSRPKYSIQSLNVDEISPISQMQYSKSPEYTEIKRKKRKPGQRTQSQVDFYTKKRKGKGNFSL
eukprot:maker-scaffold_26-snap-gene-2.57-mRNA-1 protein AED:0.00 eAED:0.00 QI:112/1/1/1/1/1/2/98/380